MKAYPEYKESGVEWLGEIPTDWKVKKLKYICDLQTGDQDTVNANPDAEYDFFVRAQKIHKISSYSHDCEAVLTAGDGVGVGKVYHYTDGKFNFHQRVYMMNNFKGISGRYFYYYLRTLFARVALDGGAKSTVDSLRMPTFTNFHFCYPDEANQKKLVEYLDREKISFDSLLSEKQNFIQLLQENRQALISHVVTKGLNPNVPMKDSGVEWVGEIPEHWEVTLLKYQTSKIGSGKTPSGGAEVYQEQGIKFLRSQNVYNDGLRLNDVVYISDEIHYEMRGSKVLANDVLLNITGGSIGRTCLAPIDIGEANVNQHVCIIRSKDESFSELLSLIMASTLVSEQVDYLQTGAGREGLNFVEIGQFKIPLPPKSEWKEIVDHLLLSESKIQCLLEETNKSIELLKEHRTALISAAVTGKIDVREMA